MTPTRKPAAAKKRRANAPRPQRELVILTGLSGSGKASALKAFEDLGYYSVDNMPVSLIPHFAELVEHSRDIQRAALVVDVREGQSLEKFPAMLR
ncbi:MAG: RNase adapter RapZ, partial [Acidobacteriaceae bacterium]